MCENSLALSFCCYQPQPIAVYSYQKQYCRRKRNLVSLRKQSSINKLHLHMMCNIALCEKIISIYYIVKLYFPFLISHYKYEKSYVNVNVMSCTKYTNALIYANLTILPTHRGWCNIFIIEFILLKLIWMHIHRQSCYW